MLLTVSPPTRHDREDTEVGRLVHFVTAQQADLSSSGLGPPGGRGPRKEPLINYKGPVLAAAQCAFFKVGFLGL